MKTRVFRVISAMGFVFLTSLLAGCPNPFLSGTGSLTVAVTDTINARTLLPGVSMDAASFTVVGDGPGSASFSRTTSGGSLTIPQLAFGLWTVDVSAFNADGILIGHGNDSAQVHSGQTTELSIIVTPLSGTGSLSLDVSWPGSEVETASIQASLVPPSGSPIALSFRISSGAARYSSSSIAAGYYTLTLQVLDHGIPVAGAVEVVRIAEGQSTTGSYIFANVNAARGTLVVNITPALGQPIPVSMAGVPSLVGVGSSVNATASVADGTPNVVYVWYLNGVSVGTGPAWSVGGLAAGYYRLDVTAFSADGTRGGSDTVSFQVAQAALAAGSLVLPEQQGYAFLAFGASMAYDPQRDIGLSIYRLCKQRLSDSSSQYTLGTSAFRATGSTVQCGPATPGFPIEENAHPGDNNPVAFDPTSGAFLFSYIHGYYVLRAARVNPDLSVEMGPELPLGGLIDGVDAISPDPGTGKILVFSPMSVSIVHLQGLAIVVDTTVSYPNSYFANLTGENKQSIFIPGRSLHAFFIQQAFGPGIVLPTRITPDGSGIEFLQAVTIPEATDYATWQSMAYDPAADSLVCAYRDSAYRGRISVLPFVAGQLTGAPSILFGNGNEYSNTLFYDTERGWTVLINVDALGGYRVNLRTITVSGGDTVISPPSLFADSGGADVGAAWDPDDRFAVVEIGTGFYLY